MTHSFPFGRCLALVFLALAGATPVAAQIVCGSELGPGGTFVATAPIGPCAEDPALTIVGPVKVDFAGQELTCTVATGDGILINGKGAKVENGSVTGCAIAVRVEGEGKHKLTRMVARNNSDDGFSVAPGADGNKLKECSAVGNTGGGFVFEQTDKNALTECVASRNGGTGFDFDVADGNKLKGLTASHNGNGVVLGGRKNKLTDSDVVASTGCGVAIAGDGTSLKQVTATGSGDSSFDIVSGDGIKLTQCTAMTGSQHGFLVEDMTSGTKISKSRAIQNGLDGIRLLAGASDAKIDKNVALHNDGLDLIDQNPGCGSNAWKKNTFKGSDPAPGGCIE